MLVWRRYSREPIALIGHDGFLRGLDVGNYSFYPLATLICQLFWR